MLRLLIVVLLVANGVYFAWMQGYLAPLGLSQNSNGASTGAGTATSNNKEPLPAHEPLRAEAIELLPTGTAAPANALDHAALPTPLPPSVTVAQETSSPVLLGAADSHSSEAGTSESEDTASTTVEATDTETETQPEVTTPAPPAPAPPPTPVAAAPAQPKQCMAVGPFSEEQMTTIRGSLQNWPRDAWRTTQTTTNGRWMVFWGGATDDLVMEARRGELQNKNIAYERLRSSPAGPGFSLGRFSSEASAKQQRRNMEQRGINGADVVVERETSTTYRIEFPDYANTREKIQRDLTRHLGGRSIQAC